MTRYLSGLLTILLASVPLTGIWAAIRPFRPYMPLDSIDYRHNRSLGNNPASIAYRPESFKSRSLLPAGLFATSLLYNDNRLDKSIIKLLLLVVLIISAQKSRIDYEYEPYEDKGDKHH